MPSRRGHAIEMPIGAAVQSIGESIRRVVRVHHEALYRVEVKDSTVGLSQQAFEAGAARAWGRR